ncbi:TorF family putative porin [Rhizomicrobium palustre]
MALAAAATPALAADAVDYGKLSAYVAVESDYRYRGISQNSKEVTPEASVNWTGPYGFYAGTWLAKTNWGGNNPSYELDLFGGKHFDLGGTDLNVEAYYYSYPDYNAGTGPKASYFEMQGYLSHTFDKLTLTATGAYSPTWSLNGGTGWYGAGTAAYALTDWLSISGTVGHQWVEKAPTDYTHYDFGATFTYKSWTLDVRYVGNDIKSADCTAFWMATKNACDDTVKANLTYNISDLFG